MRPIPEYKASCKKIGKRHAVEHVLNPADIKLFGKYGFIWQCPNKRYAALIHNHKIINRRLPDKDFAYTKGMEKLYYFDAGSLATLITLLKVPRNQQKQVELAETYETSI